MKKLNQIAVTILLFGLVAFQAQAQAPYTSFYIFGDGVSTTTNNPEAGQYYYGMRDDNGRVWVEVLAQRLGMGANSITNPNWFNSSNNCSYYGQYSPNLVTNITHYHAPKDASTALFAVWVCDADFVGDFGNIYLQGNGTNASMWAKAVSQSLTNHWLIISNLYYAKGARTIIMPNAVDITEIPQYDTYPASDRKFIRQMIINFNASFSALLNQVQSSMTSKGPLTIYKPDIFSLLDNVLTNAGAYGLTNTLYQGASVDVLDNPTLSNKALNGPGTNYIFWDAVDPSAKMHEVIADTVQQMIAPVQLNGVTVLSPSTAPVYTNQLVVANMPVGLNGFVEGTSNLLQGSWTTVTNINSISVTQSIFVNATPLPPITLPSGNGGSIFPGGGGPSTSTGQTQTNNGEVQSYRLRFPFAWSWP